MTTTSSSCAAAPTTSSSAALITEEDTTQSYQGFGSFHSENVEDLMALPDSLYTPPACLPSFAAQFPAVDAESLVLGQAIRRSSYRLSEDWSFVNHGAFGGALKPAMAIKRDYEDHMETQPLAFVDRQLLPLLVHATRELATFLRADPRDLVLVSNATFGLNAAVNTLITAETAEKVCYLDTEYGSVWKMMRERVTAVGGSLHEIALGRYLNDHDVIGTDEAVTKHIEDHLPADCTVFVVDHVASTSAIALPVFTHIIPMLRRHGVKHILVDGAHGPMQFALDFKSLTAEQRPTMYVGNLHKWMCCPKSVGFMWADKKIQAKTVTPVVSHGSRNGYLSEFVWDGTKDYGAYLSIPAVCHFWKDTIGVQKARQYSENLLKEAEAMLCAAFEQKPVARGSPFMTLVPLPAFFRRRHFSGKYIQDTLHTRFNVEVPVKDVDGKLYFRISAFVNNTMADYEKLRDALAEMRELLTVKRRRETASATVDDLEMADRKEDERLAAEAKANGGVKAGGPACGGCGIPSGPAKKTTAFSDSDEGEDE